MSEPTMVDQLAEDTKAADTPPEYPDGAPKLLPLLRVPYRRRADAMRVYGKLQAFLKSHPELSKSDEKGDEAPAQAVEVDMDAAADSYEMVAVMDDVLASVARDPDEYENWDERFDVDVFMKTWAAWQAASQPGEASSSSS